MMKLCLTMLVAVSAIGSMAANFRTENFMVDVPSANAQTAQQIGQWAEHYRREKAVQWLGKEMPTWGQPCPLKIDIKSGGAGGATTFTFNEGAILSQHMRIEGPLERVIHSVLPHEITHTVFAYYFREPLPRWADEGGSVLSEDNIERDRHDKLVRRILAGKQPKCQAYRLSYMFNLKDYPDGQEVMTLYAQGFSVCEFLVERGGRQQFLSFVGTGMRNGWDAAAQNHYQMNGVEGLQTAWLDWMRNRYQGAPDELVRRQDANLQAARPVNTPNAPPVVRGQAGEEEDARFSVKAWPTSATNPAREGWAPVYPRKSTRPANTTEGQFMPANLR